MSDTQTNSKKSKSQENDRNVNRKYKLENQKISKEFTQDFLEDYKNPYEQKQKKTPFTKVYESDFLDSN